MNLKRYVIEIGTGIDLHGEDVTNAAKKAVKDAISKSCLAGVLEILHLNINDMIVDVTIASPYPERVNGDEVLKAIPIGRKRISVINGGMLVPGLYVKEFGESKNIVVVNASVVVLVDANQIGKA